MAASPSVIASAADAVVQPTLAQYGTKVELKFGLQSWSIDAADFGARWEEVNPDLLLVRLGKGFWPGTTLPFNLSLRAYLESGTWWVRIELPGLGKAVDIRQLALWLGGEPAQFDLKGSSFKFEAGTKKFVRVESVGAPRLEFRSDNSLAAHGSIHIVDRVLSGTALKLKLVGERTEAELINPQPSQPTPLGKLKGGQPLFLDGKPSIWQFASGRDKLATITSQYAEARLDTRSEDRPFLVAVQSVALVARQTSGAQTVVSGEFANRTAAFTLGANTIELSGIAASKFKLEFGPSAPAFEFDGIIHAVHLPINGADAAWLNFAAPRKIQVAVTQPPTLHGPEYLVIAGQSRLSLTLTGSRLELRRFRDMLNAAIELDRYSLMLTRAGRKLTPFKDQEQWDSRLIVHLPPQHIAERAYFRQLNTGDSAKRQKAETSDPRPVDNQPFEPIVQGRPAGPSRLAFQIPEERLNEDWLSLATIFDWRGLPQATHHTARTPAQSAGEYLKANLNSPNPEKGSRAQLLQLARNWLQPPPDNVTAIEIPYRLLLSPDENAQWTVSPKPDPAAETHGVWRASLTGARASNSVRAIWSRDLDSNSILKGDFPKPPWPADENTFNISVRSADRREIVLLSSARFLPALKRLNANGQLDPHGSVEPLPGTWDSLEPDEAIYVPRPLISGEMALTALGGSLVAEGQWEPPFPSSKPSDKWSGLSVERWRHRAFLGRDVFAEVGRKGFLFPLGHRATFVRRTERLFFAHPQTGEAVAYLIQRVFIEVGSPQKNFPAVGQPFDARLLCDVRRITLTSTQSPDLIDPAKTTAQIPNLRPNTINGPNNGALELGSARLAFWPRLATAPGSEHQFEYRLNDEAGVMRSPLMFVENSVAHDPAAMRLVLEHYLGSATWKGAAAAMERLRRAPYDGGNVRYAPEDAQGEAPTGRTSFQTQAWSLAATGRVRKKEPGIKIEGLAGITPDSVNCDDFTMDATMEGADQPPFYPAIGWTQINVQSIERLTGRSQAVFAAPNHKYVLGGMDSGANPGQLFLDILSPNLEMSFSTAGGGSGGVAHPDMKVVHLSRSIGPVGARTITRTLPAVPSAARPAVPARKERRGARNAELVSSASAGSKPSAAESGRLDPFEFFGNAKLLGAVPLKEVIRAAALSAAPELVETVQSGAQSAADAAQSTLQLVKDIATAARRFLDDVDKQLERAAQQAAATIKWKQLYPALGNDFDELSAVLVSSLSADLTSVWRVAAALKTRTEAFLQQLSKVVADPVPGSIRPIIDEITRQWEAVRSVLGRTSEAIRKRIEDELVDPLRTDLSDLCSDATAELLLGITGPEQSGCKFDPAAPGALLARVQETLFNEVVGKPLAELAGAIQETIEQLKAGSLIEAKSIANLAERSLAFGLSAAYAATAARVEAVGGTLCKKVAAAILAIADKAFSPATNLGNSVRKLQQELANVAIESPSTTSGQLANTDLAFSQARDAALQALNSLALCLERLESSRKKMVQELESGCSIERLRLPAEVMRLRIEAATHVRDVLLSISRLIDALADARNAVEADIIKAKAVLRSSVAEIANLFKSITSINTAASAAWSATTANARDLAGEWVKRGAAEQAGLLTETLDAAAVRAKQLQSQLDAAVAAVNAAIDARRRDNGELISVAAAVIDYAAETDRRLTGLIGTGVAIAEKQLAKIEAWAYSSLAAAAAFAAKIYTAASGPLTVVNQVLERPDLQSSIVIFLRQDVINKLKVAAKAVTDERNELQTLADSALDPAKRPTARQGARTLMKRWGGDKAAGTAPVPPAIIGALNDVSTLGETLLSGRIAELIDVGAIERQLKEEIKRLIPLSVETTLKWGTKLGPFPKTDPIFQMVSPASTGPDLSIDTKVKLDLMESGRRTVTGTGILQPFQINLFGPFKLVSIFFSRATFTLGGSPRFDVRVENVQIQKNLEFIKALQSYMSGGGATGPYWSIRPPLIEVGYRYSCDQITLGALIFLNIAFEVAAELALDGRDARFRCAVATPERPLLISSPPYGGGGYAAVVANAAGIVAFEASFEFGAVTQVRFGPLNAHGRVSAGIYISQSREQGAVIAGFVNAIGEGRIACFGVSVNIQVRIEHRGGSMTGTSTYRVTFRVGLARIGYSFTAKYTFKGSKQQTAVETERANISNLVPVVVMRPRPTTAWGDHSKQFDLSLVA